MSIWMKKIGCAAAIAMALPTMAAATTIGPDAFGYSATDTVPFSWVDISGTGTSQSPTDGCDDCTNSAAIGFSFSFYGSSFTTLTYSSNGLITFGSPNASFSNVDLSTSSVGGGPTIAAFWDDLWTISPAGRSGGSGMATVPLRDSGRS